MFEDLGLKYVGPIDGHDRAAVEEALTQAKKFGGPVIVHVLTRKGFGYDPAERHEADQFHQIGAFDVETGVGTARRADLDRLLRRGDGRARRRAARTSSAITAAMLYPVGLDRFAAAYPERIFDVGIAEQHAVTSAAGLAMGGMHPVVAIYATFLNRAFDQVLMDVALHRCGVTFVLDRAGVTGNDGASHNGMWDLSILQVVPGLRIAAPRDGARVAELLREAGRRRATPRPSSGCPRARRPPTSRRSTGPAAATCSCVAAPRTCSSSASARWPRSACEVGRAPGRQGIGVTVVDPRWVKPCDPAIVGLARDHRLVVSIEDNGRVGGVGSILLQLLNDEGVHHAVPLHGIPQEFLDHAEREVILERIGLNAQTIARGIVEASRPPRATTLLCR